ncbi:hypothetical protein [Actinomadura citrea]|uniref:Uncharacterized protein n=1 Tax=Actinomadura citrea TaxID=46158 RepID=A0A7Y9G7Y6_9ACTN|nr:hypothetical protein [Actinomadura citrea]NYE11564.1 hypothetical protein [Actinomadura citrea]GGT87410.1 hypothetical protein GCM10010177_53440 [Actinomadura citrea]
MAHGRRTRRTAAPTRRPHAAKSSPGPLAKLLGAAGVIAIAVGTAQATGASNTLVGWVRDRTSGAPVEVMSVSYAVRDSGGYVFADPVRFTSADLARLSSLPWGEPEYHRWARTRGGVDPERAVIKVVLAGTRANSVRITDLRLTDLTCSAPLSGAIIAAPSQGPQAVARLGFDLDGSVRNARVEDRGRLGARYFDDKTVELKRKEQQSFQIAAVTKRKYCEFKLSVAVLDGKSQSSVTVDDGGEPFRVSGMRAGHPGPPFRHYERLYVGASNTPNGHYAEKNPRTWTGPGT